VKKSIAKLHFSEIKPGLRVISFLGNLGTVLSFDANYKGRDYNGWLVIQWDHGPISIGEPEWLQEITIHENV
jgi:hypothetical protein